MTENAEVLCWACQPGPRGGVARSPIVASHVLLFSKGTTWVCVELKCRHRWHLAMATRPYADPMGPTSRLMRGREVPCDCLPPAKGLGNSA
jgi:hypothetical protein